MVPERYLVAGGMSRTVVFAQGAYLVLTGLWPIVSMRTFEFVTGDKAEEFLVDTVGLLAIAIGVALLVSAVRHVPRIEILVLGVGAAAAFGKIDVVYVAQGVIRPVYLLDALVQAVFIVLLLVAAYRRQRALTAY